MLDIPYDVLEIIIDALASGLDDVYEPWRCLVDLKACALTNHALATLSRKHIFSTIHLVVPDAYGVEYNTLLHSQFIGLISDSPDILGFIRKFSFRADAIGVDDVALIEAILKLNKVRSLDVIFGYIRPPPYLQPVIDHLLQISTLTHLLLRQTIGFSASSLLSCLNLSHLTLDDVIFSHEWGEDILLPLPKPIVLREFCSNAGREILPLIRARRPDGHHLIDFRALRCIGSLQSSPHLHFEAFERLIGVPRQLEEFYLQCTSKREPPTFTFT